MDREGGASIVSFDRRADVSVRGEKHRILLVEDAIELGEALLQQLEVLGYECVCAHTCDEARQRLSESLYSCALIDLGLPDGRGIDLVGQLLESSPQTVPIILTGDSASESIIAAMRTGAFDYLLKPIDLMTLRTGVGRAVAHHDALRDRARLVELLKGERDLLRERIEEATVDLRQQARHLESTNSMLNAMLDVSQLASRFMTDEGLLRAVYETIEKHVPLRALALSDVTETEFLGVHRRNGSVSVVASKESRASGREAATGDETYLKSGLERYLGADPDRWREWVVETEFWGRPVCAVAFYVDAEFREDETQRQFLEMCGHFLAFEWQRSRLLLHGAQQAGLGNIAQELAKTFLQALTAVRTTTEVLAERAPEDEEGREGLRIIGDHADFLVEQAQAFHKLARVRSDSVETVRLAEYIDQTLHLLSNTIEQRGIGIEKHIDDPGECILLNGAALASTFLDLISTVVRNLGADDVLSVRVVPQGKDHILCEFAQVAEPAQSAAHRGTGRALSEIVKAHPRYLLAQRTVQTSGGVLSVERQSEHKSTFKIVLPRNGLDVQAG